jgi:hypothetical protein
MDSNWRIVGPPTFPHHSQQAVRAAVTGTARSCSPSGHLIVLTEEGELALVRADPTSYQEMTRFPAIEGKMWNHPAMSDGILLIRNIEEMAAFDLRK